MVILSVILFILAALIVVIQAQYRIAAGDEVQIEEVPYQVGLIQDGEFANCGGTIIDTWFVLTAAHCVQHYNNDLSVHLGSNHNKNGGKMIKVKKIMSHEKFNVFNYDISLLELEEEIKFDKTMQPAALPKENEDVPDGAVMKVSGWGKTESSTAVQEILRYTLVSKVNQEECRQYFSEGSITDVMLCAGQKDEGKDACSGDSGGPLVYNGTLFGVVSWGRECDNLKPPGVYTRVASFIPWIREKMSSSPESDGIPFW